MFRTVLVLAFALSALSAPQSSSSQCDSGTIQCCDTVAPAYSASVAPVLKALKINVDDENKQVALGCGGSAVGVGAGSSWYVLMSSKAWCYCPLHYTSYERNEADVNFL